MQEARFGFGSWLTSAEVASHLADGQLNIFYHKVAAVPYGLYRTGSRGELQPGSPRMTLSEASRLTGLTPATAQRSLRTLCALGYLREIDRRFLLNVKVLSLRSAYLLAIGVDELLISCCASLSLSSATRHSVSVPSGENVLYIASYSEELSVRPVARSGTTYPTFVTSMGRVLLSVRDKDETDR